MAVTLAFLTSSWRGEVGREMAGREGGRAWEREEGRGGAKHLIST